MSSNKLENQVAFVSGASSGIGEATALALASEGATIAIAARRVDKLENLSQRIQKINGGKVLVLETDISDAAQATSAINTTCEKFGRIDILVNNAGVMHLGSAAQANIEDWQQMININVLGLMYCTRAAIPFMKAQKSGHIVNLSSVAGRVARAGSSGYNASKWAVGAFSEAIRQELCADKIRVTIVEPGVTLTELTDHMKNEEVKAAAKKRATEMHALTSEDVANAILYAVTQPWYVCINEILMRPTEQQA